MPAFLLTGAKHWGKFAPVCGSGTSQSPIDLPAEDASDAVDNGAIDFSTAHLSESMEGTLKNNGHSGIFHTSFPTFKVFIYRKTPSMNNF